MHIEAKAVETSSEPFGLRTAGRHGLLAGACLLSMALLAGCQGSGSGGVSDTLDVSGQTAAGPAIDEIQDPRAYCPSTAVRPGTETFDVYPKGVKAGDEGADEKLRWRATITETARECNSAGGGQFLNIRVGVRGRYLSGPSKESGSFVMPVRIAVVQGEGNVLYSQLHQIPGEILAGKTNGVFSFVDENVNIPTPSERNVRVFVGFDEGPYDTP